MQSRVKEESTLVTLYMVRSATAFSSFFLCLRRVQFEPAFVLWFGAVVSLFVFEERERERAARRMGDALGALDLDALSSELGGEEGFHSSYVAEQVVRFRVFFFVFVTTCATGVSFCGRSRLTPLVVHPDTACLSPGLAASVFFAPCARRR
jgi:hypothetical protein